ncbi:hypothetical protein RFI_18666 [Reticulomyxa filosa]|uniref:Uncharacterized protein n=1 Tax=Reticulomyxa filosa TaxID=46433 RepID=X6MX46_RETFI|nr:hypothetical protein RFI_18666 [Reticulomyxa filosa]|eukprot:ETO18595.1 hypothetical protein RFI_18666 [Reticulomyxa filosa]
MNIDSAKKLKEGEANVAYICSRYYRAPELIFEFSFYHTTIGKSPLFFFFLLEKSVDQLIEIIKVLGTPTRREIMAMNPHYTYTEFPAIKALPWKMVFSGVTYENEPVPDDAVDILSKFLVFTPSERLDCFDALAHSYFDELRQPDLEFCFVFLYFYHHIMIYMYYVYIYTYKLGPNLFNFTTEEIELATQRKIVHTIVPKRLWKQLGIESKNGDDDTSKAVAGSRPSNTKTKTDTMSSGSSQQEYVLSRVQEIAEQRQEQEKRSVQKKPKN